MAVSNLSAQVNRSNRSKRDIEFLVVKKNWTPAFESLNSELKQKKNSRALEVCDILLTALGQIKPAENSAFYNHELYLTRLDLGTSAQEPIYPSSKFYKTNIQGRQSFFNQLKHDLGSNMYDDSTLNTLKMYYFYYEGSLIFNNDWLYKPSIYFSENFLDQFNEVLDPIETMRQSDTIRLERFDMPMFMKNNEAESFFLINAEMIQAVKETLTRKRVMLEGTYEEEYKLMMQIMELVSLGNAVLLFR